MATASSLNSHEFDQPRLILISNLTMNLECFQKMNFTVQEMDFYLDELNMLCVNLVGRICKRPKNAIRKYYSPS